MVAIEGTPFGNGSIEYAREGAGAPRPQSRFTTVHSDFVQGLAANSVVSGGRGAIFGTDSDDTLFGTRRDDTLHGGLGDDEVHAGRGGDAIFGDEGDDTLFGNRDNDTLHGGLGNDGAHGGRGEDAIFGDEGDDTLFGNRHNDTLHGGLGNDELYGGSSSDQLFGDHGDDTIVAGVGNDLLAGQGGSDILAGGGNSDTLTGGAGFDTLSGGKANDSVDGGAATDTAVFAGNIADYEITTVARVTTVTDMEPSDGDDGTDTLPGVERLQFADGMLTSSIDLAPLTVDQGFVVRGVDAYDFSGSDVSSAGDINGDGFDDIIIVVPGADAAGNAKDGAGESYVIFGTDAGFSASASGADGAGNAKSYAGESYAIFGTDAGFGASIDLAALTSSQGFTIYGEYAGAFTGSSVSSAGDLNGDGFDDLLIGASGAGEGRSYVIFGTDGEFGESIDLAALTPSDGFLIVESVFDYGLGQYDHLGHSVSSAGDVNGDGFDDLIVDAHGETYVIFGSDAGFGASIDLAALTPSQGFVINGADYDRYATGEVSSAGDINGDGFDDLLIGAPLLGGAYGTSTFYAGATYVIYGRDFTGAVAFAGTAGANSLAGTGVGEIFIGAQGDDTLVGGGGADVFQGAEGDDAINVSTLDFSLADGGTGKDTLALEGAGLSLDLTTLANNRIQGIEQIDITGTGANTLTLSVLDVLDLSDDSNMLIVTGDADDEASIGAGWTVASSGGTNGDGTTTIDGQVLQVYTSGQATLLIDQDVNTAAV